MNEWMNEKFTNASKIKWENNININNLKPQREVHEQLLIDIVFTDSEYTVTI
jgi:hypothetical protein